MRRFVAADFSDRLGRKVGAVGFDQHAIEWHGCGHGSQIVVLFIGDHAGEADIETQLNAFGGHVGRASERVHDATQWTTGVGLAEHVEDVLLAITHVNDERQARLLRQPQVPIEIVLLHGECRLVPVAIEPRFAESDDFRVCRELNDGVPLGVADFVDIIGLNTGRSIESVVDLGNFEALLALWPGATHDENLIDPRRSRAGDHSIAIGVEAVLVEMGVGVEQLRGAGSWGLGAGERG